MDAGSFFVIWGDVTWEKLFTQLKDGESTAKPIVIVTSVTYGRIFSYMKEYSARYYTFTSDQKVSGYGQSASSAQSLAESTTYSMDDIFNLGGTPLTKEVLRSKKTQSELEAAMANNMDFSASNQGVVVKYTVQLITGSNPGSGVKPLFNGKFYELAYKRCPKQVEAKINVSSVNIAGGDAKVHMDIKSFKVGSNGTKLPGRT